MQECPQSSIHVRHTSDHELLVGKDLKQAYREERSNLCYLLESCYASLRLGSLLRTIEANTIYHLYVFAVLNLDPISTVDHLLSDTLGTKACWENERDIFTAAAYMGNIAILKSFLQAGIYPNEEACGLAGQCRQPLAEATEILSVWSSIRSQ